MQEIFKHDDNIFYRLFNETDRYVSVLDTDMTILEMNQAMMSLIGCEYTNTIKDMPYWELPMWRHSPEILNMIMFSLERIFLEEDLKFEIEFQKLDGEIRDLEFTIKPLHNEKGEIDKLFALGYDTTIVKKTAYNLKRTERELSLFFQVFK